MQNAPKIYPFYIKIRLEILIENDYRFYLLIENYSQQNLKNTPDQGNL